MSLKPIPITSVTAAQGQGRKCATETRLHSLCASILSPAFSTKVSKSDSACMKQAGLDREVLRDWRQRSKEASKVVLTYSRVAEVVLFFPFDSAHQK